jgi:hypothetical protein
MRTEIKLGKKPLRSPIRGWQDNTKMDFREIRIEHGRPLEVADIFLR